MSTITATQTPPPPTHQELPQNENNILPSPRAPFKNCSSIRYMECLKNHAIGALGHVTDGCGEFLPSGEEGSFEVFICHVCNCHRNYHQQVMVQPCPDPQCCPPVPAPIHAPADVVQVTNNGEKRRYRTKFSREQKEKMYDFAEKCEWKIQKAGDPDVKSFCEEIGIKRKVLKVWMHNNKYHANKKGSTSSST